MKCENCKSNDSQYIYKEKEVCSDCVTVLAQKEKNYFAKEK